MQIIERAEAKAKGLKTYFTGRPCRNGHNSYRYTTSGSCADCVNGDRHVEYDPNKEARRAAKALLVQVRLRAYDVDRDSLASAAWALAMMRYPVLVLGDIDPRLLPTDRTAGTGLYAFYCQEEDVATLRSIAADAIKGHTVDVDARRRQIIQGAAAYLPADTTPPMSFK